MWNVMNNTWISHSISVISSCPERNVISKDLFQGPFLFSTRWLVMLCDDTSFIKMCHLLRQRWHFTGLKSNDLNCLFVKCYGEQKWKFGNFYESLVMHWWSQVYTFRETHLSDLRCTGRKHGTDLRYLIHNALRVNCIHLTVVILFFATML